MTTARTAEARKFPMDGFADTCIGHDRPTHGADVVNDDALCSDCDRALTAFVTQRAAVARQTARQARPGCVGGCRDHGHGSRYYDCFCCYGD